MFGHSGYRANSKSLSQICQYFNYLFIWNTTAETKGTSGLGKGQMTALALKTLSACAGLAKLLEVALTFTLYSTILRTGFIWTKATNYCKLVHYSLQSFHEKIIFEQQQIPPCRLPNFSSIKNNQYFGIQREELMGMYVFLMISI
ncbi:MAG: hypothetical protein KDH98_07965 [Calditrichaeota bacterium]|nr:hypothetical protein [Calditrichota bacterium]